MTDADLDRLRLTVRRCTALLVGVVGVHMGAVARYDNNWPAVLVTGAVLYLVWSFVLAPLGADGTPADDSGTAGDGTASPADGADGDGAAAE